MTEPDAAAEPEVPAPEPPWKPVAFAAIRQRDQFRAAAQSFEEQAMQLEINLNVTQHEATLLGARVAELEAENASLKARLEEVEAAARPADAKPKAKDKGAANGDL